MNRDSDIRQHRPLGKHHLWWGRSLLVGVVLALGGATAAWGHGARLQAQSQQGILVMAIYENGEPMANAQVQVYSPEDPRNPRWIGTTDEEGRYFLLPDVAGDWEVAVRQAGHGNILKLPVEDGALVTLESQTPQGLSPLQRGLIAAAVTWGCVGTALFLWGDRRRPSSITLPTEGLGGQE